MGRMLHTSPAPDETKHPSPRPLPGAAMILVLVTALGWLTLGGQDGAFPVERADSTADWLAASAFAAGLDPHADLRELANSFDVRYWEEYDQTSSDRVVRHPRTPGTLVLLYPLSWITAEQARVLMLVAALFATAATFMILWRARVLTPVALLVGTALAMVSGPARWSQLFVTQSAIVMLCVAVVLIGTMRGDVGRTGSALAIAGTLKLFPLVLVVLLVARRRYRTLALAIGLFAALNLIPILLPHVSMASMVDAFALTADSWTDITPGLPGLIARWTTVDLPMLLLVAGIVLLPVLYLVFRDKLTYGAASLTLLAAALVVMPLSWPHYLLSLIPPFVLTSREVRLRSVFGVVLAFGAILLVPMTPVAIHTLGLSVIVIGVTVSGIFVGQSLPRLEPGASARV